jgi:uncharacterized protein YraI
MNVYARKRIWFNILMGVGLLAILGAAMLSVPGPAGAYQEAATPAGVIITVTYTDPINVRSGPSTTLYPIIGQLNPGATAQALGVSTAREWVQIAFPGGVNGTGWVYAAYVSVSGGELQVAEAPPTSTPLVTNTVDPTLAAQFAIQPTRTRLPTFTPPAPLTMPQYEDESPSTTRVFGIFIVTLGLLGALGLIVSFLLQK